MKEKTYSTQNRTLFNRAIGEQGLCEVSAHPKRFATISLCPTVNIANKGLEWTNIKAGKHIDNH